MGMLKDLKTGRTVSHEHARTVIGSQAGDDVANLQDLQAFDTLASVDEDSDSEVRASGQNHMFWLFVLMIMFVILFGVCFPSSSAESGFNSSSDFFSASLA